MQILRDPEGKQMLRRRRRTLLVAGIVLATAALIVLILLIPAGYSQPWTGFGDVTNPKGEVVIRGKTLWDWLDLLVVPIAVAIATVLFTLAASARERDIALNNAHEASLQSYLDKMTELLLKEGLGSSTAGHEVRAVAKARTVAVLRGLELDSARKSVLVRFLGEAGLHRKELKLLRLADLRGVDLIGADLRGAFLDLADLRGAWLAGADLSEAVLIGADLSGAALVGANLSGAFLDLADLSRAVLSGADLSGAVLSKADLSEADLSGVKHDAATEWPPGFTPPPDAIKVEQAADNGTSGK